MKPPKPSAWFAADGGTSPGTTHDRHGVASTTVRLQLSFVDRRWHVEVERNGRRHQLDGMKDLSRYLDQLAIEASAAPVRGLR